MSKTIFLAVQAGRVVLSVNDIELHITPEMARRIAEKLPEAADLAEKTGEAIIEQETIPWNREDHPAGYAGPWLPKLPQVVQ